jgi:hypothetical protein
LSLYGDLDVHPPAVFLKKCEDFLVVAWRQFVQTLKRVYTTSHSILKIVKGRAAKID